MKYIVTWTAGGSGYIKLMPCPKGIEVANLRGVNVNVAVHAQLPPLRARTMATAAATRVRSDWRVRRRDPAPPSKAWLPGLNSLSRLQFGPSRRWQIVRQFVSESERQALLREQVPHEACACVRWTFAMYILLSLGYVR